MTSKWKGILKNQQKTSKHPPSPTPNTGFILQSLKTKVFQKDFLRNHGGKKRIPNTPFSIVEFPHGN